MLIVKEKLVKRATQIALALSPQSRGLRRSHVAFLIKKGKIEKIGLNKAKTHPKIPEHPYHEGHVGIHAELDCILKVDKEDFSDYKMLVLRVGRDNKLMMSKPCSGCQSLLKQFSISDVWYSNSKGEIEKL